MQITESLEVVIDKEGQATWACISDIIVNRVDSLETHYNDNRSHYLCWSTFKQK